MKWDEVQAADDVMLRALLDAGADVEARDLQTGQTALIQAAFAGRGEATRMLLEAGAGVEAKDRWDGRTALMEAAIGGHEPVIRLLLAAGADVDAEDFEGNSAADLAAYRRKHEVVPLLRIGDGDRPSRPDRWHSMILREAAERGDAAAIRGMLATGADPNMRLSGGITPLLMAASWGHVEVVAALIDVGADVEARGPDGDSPLIAAIRAGCPESVRLLLDAGADPDGEGAEIDEWLGHETPLFVAIGERATAVVDGWQGVLDGDREGYQVGPESLAIVGSLIAAGADVEAEDGLGTRPLWYACDTGQAEITGWLAEAGAGLEPVGAAYLRAWGLPGRARGEAFRRSVAWLASECGSDPEPILARPTHRDFHKFRRGDEFPTGPVLGVRFVVACNEADRLVATNQARLQEEQSFLFVIERGPIDESGLDYEHSRIALLPVDDPYTVIAAVCWAGSDRERWMSPGFLIRDLRALGVDHPFALVGCESHLLELEFAGPIRDAADLARRLMAMPGTPGGEGVPEEPDEEDVAEALLRHRRIHLYW